MLGKCLLWLGKLIKSNSYYDLENQLSFLYEDRKLIRLLLCFLGMEEKYESLVWKERLFIGVQGKFISYQRINVFLVYQGIELKCHK